MGVVARRGDEPRRLRRPVRHLELHLLPLRRQRVAAAAHDARRAAGNFCGRIECWRQLGGTQGTIQWVYNSGNAYGLTQIRLKPGGEGAAKITVTARGANLPLPPTPLTGPVVFQAQATNGECWSAEYDAPFSRNEPGVFKANPTVP